MGRKGKKKPDHASTAGSSSGQEHQRPQQQQQQQHPPQQQQQQQRPPQQQQQQQLPPQQQQQQQQQQRPPRQQQQQQQRPPQQQQQQCPPQQQQQQRTPQQQQEQYPPQWVPQQQQEPQQHGGGTWRRGGSGEAIRRGEGRGRAGAGGHARKEMKQLEDSVQRIGLIGQGDSTSASGSGHGYRQEQGHGGRGGRGGGAGQQQCTEMPPYQYQAQPAQQIPPPQVSPVSTGPPSQTSKASTPLPTPATVPVQAPLRQETVTSPRKAQGSGMALPIPVRKNPLKAGTKGRPIQVETNMMAIHFGPKFNPNAIHYDVDFNPDKPKFLLKLAYEATRQKYFPNRFPAYDGKKNLFSANDLPFGNQMSCDITVFDPERQQERTVKVTIKKVNVIDLSWLRNVQPGSVERDQLSMQVLDVILRCGAAARSVTVGRNLFQQPKGQVVSLTGGLELWVGAFQSAVLGWKPLLNIDVAHKGFPTAQNVIDLMKELAGGGGGGGGRYRQERPREIGPEDIERAKYDIEKFLKGLKVVYEIPGLPTSRRTQRVNGLVDCAQNCKFKLDDGKETTVFEYYRTSRNYTLRFPRMPCLWVGSRERFVYYPAELCTLASGQVLTKKMDETQTSKMIREAATSTEERKRKIMNAFNSINYNNDPSVKEFGLSVGGGFEKVAARVLEPPGILYHNANRPVPVRKGVWRAEKFLNPAHLPENSWTILNLNERFVRERDIYQLHDELCRVGKMYGMEIGGAKTPFCNQNPRNFRDIINFFEKQKEQQIRLVIVIVPDSGNTYSKVKQVAELRVGCLTQCVKSRTISRLSEATVGNILLKINSKLNGINHTFITRTKPRVLLEPCMIVGADVTHPSPDAKDIPSIAAVAASHDPKVFKFSIEIRLQPPREEIILDLEEIIRIQLRTFHQKTGYIPRKIIFYRDGVSEGQFSTVMINELRAIQRACQSMQKDGGYKPPITFLVVQKRHHVRLFPTAPENSDDWHKNKNVQAGTVVDTTITHPSHIDFYLVSHASIQGTARPTKYRCLWDDSDMSEDEIEELTYYLCHMFSRCTRSVSYPTPTYYAHLAAFRARALTQEVNINLNNLSEEQRNKLTLNKKILENPMFFV